jgi:hypothetical protein
MLLDLTLDYTGRRPFVCDGRPEDSAVLIVGLTPGTEMKADWRGWWVDERFNTPNVTAALDAIASAIAIAEAPR